MLTITILGEEQWNEVTERFFYPNSKVVEFEHSLVSLSKWEAKFHKPFLTKAEKTVEEQFGYLRAMVLTPDVTDEDLAWLTESDVKQLEAYINDPMTGTTFPSQLPPSRSSETISAELVYYWMNEYHIDYEAREWHLNQLFTQIRVHHTKRQKPKKVPQAQQAQTMAEINAQRKAKMGTTG